MSKIRYAVWGKDRSYRWLWLAALVAGWEAAKKRYKQRTTHDDKPPRYKQACKEWSNKLAP